MIESAVLRKDQDLLRHCTHDTTQQNLTARIAVMFADHMVLASDQGSAIGAAMGDAQPHEAKSNLMPVGLIVQRACNLAEALIAEMTRREWITEGPRLEEIITTKDVP